MFSALFQWLLAPYLSAGKDFAATQSDILKVIAPLGFILIACSLLEAFSTLFLGYKGASDPTATFVLRKYLRGEYLKNNIGVILSNRTILACILALSVF